jgi:iron(III) transport system ATP-binding protein
VDARDFAEGDAVDVLVRPEAVRVVGVGEPSPEHNRSHVIASRLLGRYSLLHLCVHGGAQEMHLHARVHGLFLPEAGQTVELDLDDGQVFVFPASTVSDAGKD